MSSRSDCVEYRWQPSRWLLTAYLILQAVALFALALLDIPLLAAAAGIALCVIHGLWVLPRSVLLFHPSAFTGLQRDHRGWRVWNERGGWQPVQLCRDSLALPWVVILRFRLIVDGRPVRNISSCCVPFDALAPDEHRRLRVRLKFSRRRWAVSE